MNKSTRALHWLHENHGWNDDMATWRYIDRVLQGYAANSFTDQSLIIAAGHVSDKYGK